MENKTKNILMITTGGTIEKTYSEDDGSLKNRETIIHDMIYEKLRLPFTELTVNSLMAKDSLDMVMEDRLMIYQKIRQNDRLFDGIIVLHGTDTMTQTTDFCFQKSALDGAIQIPVVFTGAMKPLGFDKSDAIQNVVEAMLATKLLPPGWYVSFHNEVYQVPRVRKNKDKRTFEPF